MSPAQCRAAAFNRKVTLGIWAFTVTAWIASIVTDMLSLPDAVDADLRGLALASTVIAGNAMVVAQLIRSNQAAERGNELLSDAYKVLKDLQRGRPDPEAVTPPPWQRLRSVADGDGHAPQNGQRASR